MRTRSIRGVTPELIVAARTLRRDETSVETILWQALPDRGLGGLRFRRQYAMGQFVLDFYCPALRLVVEVDGGIHDTPEQIDRDQARTAHPTATGYTEVRRRNHEVLHDPGAALAHLASLAAQQRECPVCQQRMTARKCPNTATQDRLPRPKLGEEGWEGEGRLSCTRIVSLPQFREHRRIIV